MVVIVIVVFMIIISNVFIENNILYGIIENLIVINGIEIEL